jgi:hypothetical protein
MTRNTYSSGRSRTAWECFEPIGLSPKPSSPINWAARCVERMLLVLLLRYGTVKDFVLVLFPPAFVTEIGPVLAPAGTVTLM